MLPLALKLLLSIASGLFIFIVSFITINLIIENASKTRDPLEGVADDEDVSGCVDAIVPDEEDDDGQTTEEDEEEDEHDHDQ